MAYRLLAKDRVADVGGRGLPGWALLPLEPIRARTPARARTPSGEPQPRQPWERASCLELSAGQREFERPAPHLSRHPRGCAGPMRVKM